MDEDAVLAAAGKAVTVRGTIGHAGKLSEGTALLVLRTKGSRRLLGVEIEAPLAQTGVPVAQLSSLEGKTVEADGVLTAGYGKARVTITPASSLRFVTPK